MAVTLTDDRTIVSEADATTGWTGSVTVSTGTADPTPMEATNWLGMRNNNTTVNAYFTISSTSLTNQLVTVWAFPRTVLDTKANGGLQILLGDGTNRIGFHIAGDDEAAFRNDIGPTSWWCAVLDTAKLATYAQTVYAGSFASLNVGAITQIGIAFKATVAAQGNVPNCYWDIVRRNAAGVGITITAGSAGDPGKFDQIATEDRSTANQRAHGIVRRLATGLFGVQGYLKFGSTGSASTYFHDKNVAVAFEARGLDIDKYGITVQGNGTGSTDFRLGTKVGSGVTATGADGCSIIVPAGVGAVFDATHANVTNCLIYGTRFSGFTQGVKLKANQEFIGGVIDGSGTIEVGGGAGGGSAILVNTSISGSTATRALLWNTNADPDGDLDGCKLTMGASGHGIELGANTPSTITLRGVAFNSYGADGSTDAAIYNNSGKAITLNIIGGTVPTIRNGAGASTTIVANPVTALVKVVDAGAVAIQNARVLVTAASGGPFPFQATVTITRSGSTATVTHNAHGLATNDKVMIKGATQVEYDGVFTITVTGANSYTFAVAGSPATPATGTIKSTFVVLSGLTDVNGEISMSRVFSSNQPITGKSRKSTTAPLYKTAPITGTVSSSTGFSATIQMTLDQ